MVLERLRSATHAAHAQIEGAVRLLPEPTRTRYLWFLEKQYGFYVPLEARWAECVALPAGFDWDQVTRAVPMLVKDLLALGVDPAGLPLCRSMPDLGTTARALGVLYVVEGSTLGSQVLARRIKEVLGIGPDDGAAFVQGHGPRTRPNWEAVCSLLETFGVVQPQAIGELLASAADCFACLRRWLDPGERGPGG